MCNNQKPLKLYSNRVWRTYTGGRMLEQWQGLADSSDSHFPEDWVASVVRARNPGRDNICDEGFSYFETKDGCKEMLKQLIESDPIYYLGERHSKKYGSNTALLIKLLDSAERLTIQVHPDSEAAKNLFHSDFGKTEAWYVIGGREINGEPPYVLLGFKPGITEEIWRKLFDTQDIESMINALHKFYIKPGQVYLLEGGTPHAIGSGCFLVEIQEPTDYTIRVERHTPAGQEVTDALCHQGIGFNRIFDCFHYETYTREEVLKKWCLDPITIHKSDTACEKVLVGLQNTVKFSMNSIEIKGSYEIDGTGFFSVIIVLSGSGKVSWLGGETSFNQGEQLFLPAGLGKLVFKNNDPYPLNLIRCFPPV
jgi:mannose-6-phosphate isomerase